MKPVHLHKSSLYNNSTIFLLLIPPIIFIAVIVVYLVTVQNSNSKVVSQFIPTILGNDNVNLDKTGN
ncbi:hypothetical protein A2715_01395 [Candidatus Woesebacteria bacterium RIFCSPHIGHO2_01_FULL_39_32]|uniref:Uncharacterized protein n=1 Tax=Candidatus Woesebacteria bacterium RIFCSPLOWO2_01_FULL_39_25 TaxID=1802521 RepID=A0A1F8BLS3_9BACT|nr:MAG: hypothetical protein A2124_03820 [Candidatus Woesebacteria bacterium GWB1_37_5]OGM24136.1 MAG: hypothetical protein A2715_01395 [Candidatus Woesebacteria bacterium RIFCSPHIGHO2_01_FULL_39_32]OGM38112.1 MAG: hypothetical protein A3F01_02165 [Candidatus Woesebacteria bacterium RIFCSPHIGHO2_12_FULL_38_11]OGM64218.1 MAG: hypothetical protein A2893_06660 [Candidatus Woesebacteria bacterium RIFCSPLOWO2_01_FULL_39_25]